MLSMTPMISVMRRALCWMASTDCTARAMASAPLSAALRTSAARASALRAVCALFCTADESCSTLAAVCSRLAACCSVRSARERLPCARLCPAWATSAALLRMSATMEESVSTIRSSDWAMDPTSSRPLTPARADKSPRVVCSIACATLCRSEASPIYKAHRA